MISINNLSVEFSAKSLFDNINYVINKKDKIALVGKNGAGKSTMLKIIAGLQHPTSGSVAVPQGVTIGYLPQHMTISDSLTVIEEVRKAFSSIDEMHARFDRLNEQLSSRTDYDSPEYQKLIDNITTLTEHIAMAESENCEAEMEKTLIGLGFKRSDFNRPTAEFSGGWRMRIELAKLLLTRPDVLLLDEPTNHLDIEIIEWLENYLTRSRVTLLMVTHDRYFLDRVCNKIIEIDRQQIFTYEGNYDYYLRRRQERIDAMTSELAKVKNTLRKEQEWMRRQPQARAGKAKYRIDAFYDLKKRSHVDLSDDNVELNVKSSYIGSKIFEAKGINKRFGDKVILDDFNYTFARYEKLGIIGHNGAGKSTFIKMLQGIVPADSGEWNVGETVRFGYYSQEGIEFDDNKRVIDAITEIAEDIVVNGDVRYTPMQFLTHFLFSPTDQQKYIHTLSGGERARLHLAAVLMRSPNFLILDEPTNDLDIMTLGILEDYLAKFKGCLIVVSHDRFFLDSIVDHLFVFEGDGAIKDFPGGYTDYRTWLNAQPKPQAEAEKQAAKTVRERPRRSSDNRMSYKEMREFEALTNEIEKLNAEKAALDAVFNSGEVVDDIIEKSARYEEIKALLDEKEMRWLELSEKDQ